MPASLELLVRSPASVQQLHLLSLITALARSSEEAGAELAQAGAPAVLLQMVAIDPLPPTQVRAELCLPRMSRYCSIFRHNDVWSSAELVFQSMYFNTYCFCHYICVLCR